MSDEEKKAPTHTAYTVRNWGGDDPKAYWTEIGTVFQHKDGQGFDVLLNAMPFDGQITLRANTDKPAAEGDIVEDEIPH